MSAKKLSQIFSPLLDWNLFHFLFFQRKTNLVSIKYPLHKKNLTSTFIWVNICYFHYPWIGYLEFLATVILQNTTSEISTKNNFDKDFFHLVVFPFSMYIYICLYCYDLGIRVVESQWKVLKMIEDLLTEEISGSNKHLQQR